MTEVPLSPDPTNIRKRDFWIILGFFLFSCVCISGAAVWFVIFFREAQQNQAKVATQTQEYFFAQATAVRQTQEAVYANATSTHIASATERAGFEFIDHFNNNDNNWYTDQTDDEYMKGNIQVRDGFYTWKIEEAKRGFVYWGDKSIGRLYLNDFDLYVDAKRSEGSTSAVCYGVRFRISGIQQLISYYTYIVCDNGYFQIAFYDGRTQDWEILKDWTWSETILADEWNTVGVSARGSHFTFTINDWVVAELDDERLENGGVGVLIDIQQDENGIILFDNFTLEIR